MSKSIRLKETSLKRDCADLAHRVYVIRYNSVRHQPAAAKNSFSFDVRSNAEPH